MIDPDSIPTHKTIWVCADDPIRTGNGSKTNPIRTGGNLDTVTLGPSVRLHLLPGNYTTSGIACDKVFILDGDLDVTITLNPNMTSAAVARMFSDWNNWCSFFSIRGVILDGNYLNQPGSQTGNFKVEPISVQTIVGAVKNVKIRNFGAAAKDYGLVGLECFPLSMTTFASGDKSLYDPRYSNLIELSPSRLEITDCTVDKPHFTDGGYCTGIFVKTSLGFDKGDRQKFGTRTTQAALIQGNTVNVPGGICYGAANVEQTLFADNVGSGKCAFNLDTGVADLLTIRNNIFTKVSQGLNLSPDSGGSRIEANDNAFILDDPFYNTVTKQFEDQWGVKSARIGMSSANRNTFTVPSSWPLDSNKILIGIGGVENIIRHANELTPTARDNPFLQESLGKIKSLEMLINTTQLDLDTANATIVVNEQRLAKLVSKLSTIRATLNDI